MQCRHFFHLTSSYGYKTLQGVPLDSLGVGTIEIGCIIVPDCHQHCQEVLKHIPAMLVGFWGFFVGFVWLGGGVGGTTVRSSHYAGAGHP